jgi:hypothetical protein
MRLVRDFRGRDLDTCVVERGIEAPERGDRALHHGGDLRLVGHIAHHGDRLAASGRDLIRRGLQGRFIHVRQRDGRSGPGECTRRIEAHAGGRAGDQRYLSLEVVCDVQVHSLDSSAPRSPTHYRSLSGVAGNSRMRLPVAW